MNELKNIYPIRDCEFEEKDNLVVVKYFNKKPSFIEKIFFKKQLKKPFKIDLDEIGSFIWHKCNGENTVEDLVSLAKEEFKEKVNPAEDRVETFIKQMSKNKLVKLFEKK